MSQINPQEILDRGILMISNNTKVQQVGVDLTIQEEITIPNLQGINVLLNETIQLPNSICAMLYGRSSFNRKGVLIRGSVYDPGYHGQIGCTIYNLSGQELYIPKNERICQIVFFKAEAASDYNGQYQNEFIQESIIKCEKCNDTGATGTAYCTCIKGFQLKKIETKIAQKDYNDNY